MPKGQFDGDWDVLAKELSYGSKQDMFYDLYVRRSLSISEIAHRLGSGTATIGRHLNILGIEKRTRGGKNNPGKQTYKLFHLDQRVVLSGDIDLIASKIGVSRFLLYKYRVARTRRQVDGLLHTLAVERSGTLLNTITNASAAAASADSTLSELLRGDEEEG